MSERLTETVEGPLHPYPSRVSLPVGHVIAGRYEILRVLGCGGSAVVYAVFDLELKRHVALKLLRSDKLSPTSARRLRREVALAREAASPRLLRVYDIGESDDGPFLTMEHVDAPTLRAVLEEGPLAIDEVIRLATEIAEALGELHALGIVHRDIKPSNLLIVGSSVKLADFGLAFHLDSGESRLTQSAAVVGTLEYVSPEQALGRDVDFRTDLYSLGIVMFEMLAGRPPFETPSTIATLVAHIQRSAPDVRTFRPDTPPWLAQVVKTLLQKDPSERFQNSVEVVAALRRKQVPWRRRLTNLRTWSMALLIVAAVLAGAVYADSRRFARLVHDGHTLTAVNRYGSRLWSIGDVLPANHALVRQGGKLRYVAVMRGLDADRDRVRTHTLLLLHPRTGAVERRVLLPGAPQHFPEFAPTFGAASVRAFDLDGKGNDTVVVVFTHSPYWPNYAVVHDPWEGSSKVVFVATGHHQSVTAADVNGDGRRDLIFAGVDNRMGWYASVAAVDGRFRYPAATTAAAVLFPQLKMLWQTLLRRGHVASIRSLPSALEVELVDGGRMRLGFDGFVAPSKDAADSARRTRHRDASHRALQECMRLTGNRFFAEALAMAERAVAEAMLARDATLVEWSRRMRAGLLVRTGEIERAQAEYDALMASSTAGADICFDAAREFHLTGQLDRAVKWYHRGVGVGAIPAGGRGGWEFIEGEVFALVGGRRWSEALHALEPFGREYVGYPADQEFLHALQQYVRWRRGVAMEPITLIGGGYVDEVRYWDLERRNLALEPPAELLAKIDALLGVVSTARPMVRSLRAEVLLRAGRTDEARALAREAYEEAVAKLDSEVLVRAHMPVVRERYERIAHAAAR